MDIDQNDFFFGHCFDFEIIFVIQQTPYSTNLIIKITIKLWAMELLSDEVVHVSTSTLSNKFAIILKLEPN